MEWFLYDKGLRHERVNVSTPSNIGLTLLQIAKFHSGH